MAQVRPNPGRPTLHRLNRTEYANAIRDLLALEIDVAELLPADDIGYGFDNIGDVLTVSPVLLERYLLGGRQDQPAGRGRHHDARVLSDLYHSARAQSRRSHERRPAGRLARRHRHSPPLSGRRRIRDFGRPAKGPDRRVFGHRAGAQARSEARRSKARAVHHCGHRVVARSGHKHGRTDRIAMRIQDPPAGEGRHAHDRRGVPERYRATGRHSVQSNASTTSRPTSKAWAAFRLPAPTMCKGPGHTPSRDKIFICHPAARRRGRGLRGKNPRQPRPPRLSAADCGGRHAATARPLQARCRDRRLRVGRETGVAEDPGVARIHLPRGVRSGGRGCRQRSPGQRRRAGVAPVLLPVEQHSRRRAARRRRARRAQRPVGPGEPGPAHAGRSALARRW